MKFYSPLAKPACLSNSLTPSSPSVRITEYRTSIGERKNNHRSGQDFPDVLTGRNRTPVEQTLRFLVLKAPKEPGLPLFSQNPPGKSRRPVVLQVSGDKVPCFKTLQNQISQISEETIKAVNDRVMAEARKLEDNRGQKDEGGFDRDRK